VDRQWLIPIRQADLADLLGVAAHNAIAIVNT